MTVARAVRMRVGMVMFVRVIVTMQVLVPMIMGEVDIELHAFDGGLVRPADVKMIVREAEFFQFLLQLVCIHANINQRADEHIAADAAEDVEI
jgi:hypothetical protein